MGRLLEAHPAIQTRLGVSSFEEFTTFVLKTCPEIEILRAIANGSKHFATDKKTVKTTSQEGGWDNSAWDTTPWDYGYLKIDLADGRSVALEDVAKVSVSFWESFFSKNIAP